MIVGALALAALKAYASTAATGAAVYAASREPAAAPPAPPPPPVSPQRLGMPPGFELRPVTKTYGMRYAVVQRGRVVREITDQVAAVDFAWQLHQQR